jgi:hypothetical protein
MCNKERTSLIDRVMKDNLASQCGRCGTTLASDGGRGVCPRCAAQVLQAAPTEIPGDAAGGSSRFTPPTVVELAALFPQLEVLALIGQGGMGAVYKARQPALGRLVALKLLPVQPAAGAAFGERFNREARALARLSHPHIVAVYDFGHVSGVGNTASEAPATAGAVGGFHYFLMEFVDGVNLRQLERNRRLSPREALQIVPQICDALQYAHDEGIVHRDIKPENILIDRRGRVKIADFGLAKLLDAPLTEAHLTAEGMVMGTPHYMAPEQIEHPRDVDHRADIFSLGVVFYELLTGELPLGRFPPPSWKGVGVQVDVRLDDVVLRALEKEPERRYQQASEVKTAVQTIAASAPASATTGGSTPKHGWEYDFQTRQQLLGWPLVHVTWGLDAATGRWRTARGLVAVGPIAKGLVAVGLAAFGVLPVGLVAGGGAPTGLISLGVAGVGLLALALLTATGFVAIAPFPSGVVAVDLASLITHPDAFSLAMALSLTLLTLGAAWGLSGRSLSRTLLLLLAVVMVVTALGLAFRQARRNADVEATLRGQQQRSAGAGASSPVNGAASALPGGPKLDPAKAIQAILDYGGFITTNHQGQVTRVSLVYDEDAQGQRRECPAKGDEVTAWLPALTNLTELLLHGNQATDRAMESVARLPHLRALYLWYAQVSDYGVAKLAGLSELEKIHICNTSVGDASLASLARLPKLKELALQYNRFTDEGLAHLRAMPQLTRLWIGMGSGRVTDAGIAHLVGLTNLVELDLQNYPITDQGLAQLKGLLSLRKLYLGDSMVSRDGETMFRAAIPGLEFQ